MQCRNLGPGSVGWGGIVSLPGTMRPLIDLTEEQLLGTAVLSTSIGYRYTLLYVHENDREREYKREHEEREVNI